MHRSPSLPSGKTDDANQKHDQNEPWIELLMGSSSAFHSEQDAQRDKAEN